MITIPELLALAERVESDSGPDTQLDYDVTKAIEQVLESNHPLTPPNVAKRSEERRVGKEC